MPEQAAAVTAADTVAQLRGQVFRILSEAPGRARLSPSAAQAEARLMLELWGAVNQRRNPFLIALAARGITAAEIARCSGMSLNSVREVLRSNKGRRPSDAAAI